VHFVNFAPRQLARVRLCTSGVRFVNRAATNATKLTFRTLVSDPQPTRFLTQRS